MAMTLLSYRAVMAELHSDDRRRQARTAGKVRAARATRRRKGSDMAALLVVTAVVLLAVAGGFLGADSRDGADWSPPRVPDRWVPRPRGQWKGGAAPSPRHRPITSGRTAGAPGRPGR